jgi:hypothetical protein
MVRIVLFWCVLLTVGLFWLYIDTHKPMPESVLIPPEVYIPAAPYIGGDDVAVDVVSGQCYRLEYIPATNHSPSSVVTTDGVQCPWGIGKSSGN